nr:DNA primase [Ligilactobacillus hayakitensis]
MASRIPPDIIDNIRDQVNILDVVEQFVPMHQSGKNWFGNCPFHQENTPSFSVNEQKQIFNCFSCHRGGNVFKFIMELEGLSFPESVKRVAELANVTVNYDFDATFKQRGSIENSSNSKIKQLYEQTAKLYHHILVNTKLGEEALEYLHQRGMTDEIINDFNLGFAPGVDILETFYKEQDIYDYQILRKSGIFIERQEGKLVERFNERVIYPIRDESGKTIAFSGRLLKNDPQAPKYLNSPETPIFNKRKVLFNLDRAKGQIRRNKEVFLFEGFMDVISASVAGVENGVASMGTSLTDEQVYSLSRISNRMVVCYDGDTPGQNATKRALEIVEPTGNFTIEVIDIPEKLDPDEYIRKYGAVSFKSVVDNQRLSPIEFYLKYFENGRNMDNESEQAEYIDDILNELAKVKDSVQRELFVNRISDRFNLDKRGLEQKLVTLTNKVTPQFQDNNRSYAQNSRYQNSSEIEQNKSIKKLSKVERAEQVLLYRMLHNRDIWFKISTLEKFNFIHERYQVIYTLAEAYFQLHDTFQVADFLDFINDDALKQTLVGIEMNDLDFSSSEEEIDDYLNLIMEESPLEEQIQKIQNELAEAKRFNDHDKITNLTIELVKLYRKQQKINSI